MQEIAVALFESEFTSKVVQFQGLMSFILLSFWLLTTWRSVLEQARASRENRIWAVVSLVFGIFMAVTAGLDWGSEYALLAISLGLSLSLAVLHPGVAVSLMMSLLFFRPWELIAHNDYLAMLPKLTFSLCIAHAFLKLSTRKGFLPRWNRTATYLALFATWALITTFKAPDPTTAQIQFYDSYVKCVFLFAMIMNALESESDLRLLQGTLVLTFLGVGVISIYQTAELNEAMMGENHVRLLGIGAFSNSNDIAALMALVIPFSWFRIFRANGLRSERALAVVSLVVSLAAIYYSQSRGAVLALGVSGAVYFFMKVKTRWLRIAALAGALSLVPVYLAISSRDADDLQGSSSSRITYIKAGLNMALRNPVLGVGFQAYEENFERYGDDFSYEWGNRTAHNSWIQVLAETGLPGITLFILVFITAVGMAKRVFPVAPEYLVALSSYGVAMTFLSHAYVLYPYLMFGLIGVAHRIWGQEPRVAGANDSTTLPTSSSLGEILTPTI